MPQENEDKPVIYYRRNDYASLSKRISAILVDLFVIGLLGYILSIAWTSWIEKPDFDLISEFGWLSAAIFSPSYFWTLTISTYIYLAIIKKSQLRTVSYRILNLKIIDAKGNPPSLLRMSWRFFLLVFGPLNLLIDFLWLGGDNYKQTLRDKLAGTYVIRSDAKPEGKGTLTYERYNLLGMSMIFAEIKAEDKDN
jgi:uncharacterized RDD family membrane protein YckC